MHALLPKPLPLFEDLPPEPLEEVLAAARQHTFPPETHLFRQGDPADRFYVLLEGQVKLTQVTPEGQQVLLRYVSAGEAFAIVAVLSKVPFPVTAQAVESCTCLVWEDTAMKALMLRHPALTLNALGVLARHIQEFQDRFREMSTERVERRVARALLRLARQTGRRTEEGVLLDIPLTRQDLAEMTGTTLYTVSRILSQWEKNGLVRSKREQVVILTPHSLVTIADEL